MLHKIMINIAKKCRIIQQTGRVEKEGETAKKEIQNNDRWQGKTRRVGKVAGVASFERLK